MYDDLPSTRGFATFTQPKTACKLDPDPSSMLPSSPKNEEPEPTYQPSARQEIINMMLEKANDISNDLHNFKEKSKEIQAKIQHDINSIKLLIDFNLQDDLRIKKEKSIETLEKALINLKLELKNVSAVIAEIRKYSNSKDSSLKPELTSMRLKLLTDTLFYKSVQMKWVSAEIKAHLAREQLLRVGVAQALTLSNNNVNKETPVPPTSPKPKPVSVPNSTLSDAIFEMASLINKLSFQSADQTPTTEPDFNEKTPTVGHGQTIHSETSKTQTKTTNPPVYEFGVKPPDTNSSDVTEPTNASQPSSSFEFKPTITKLFGFKPTDIHKDTSKENTTVPLSNPMTNLFGAKPTASFDVSEPAQDSRASTFKFETPIFKPLLYKSTTRSETKPQSTDPLNDQKTSNGVSAINASQPPGSLKKEPLFKRFQFKPINTEPSKPQTTAPPSNPITNLFGSKPVVSSSFNKETSKPQTTGPPINPMSNLLGAKPTTSKSFNFDTSKPQATDPPSNLLTNLLGSKEAASKSFTFEAKKVQTADPPSNTMTNLFGSKPVASSSFSFSNVSAPAQDSRASTFKFETPIFKPLLYKSTTRSETKPHSTDPLNNQKTSNGVSASPKSSQPPGSFESTFKPFEFKLTDKDSKPQATNPPTNPVTNLFGSKPVASSSFSSSNVSTPAQDSQSSFKFELPIFKPFEFKSTRSDTSKPTDSPSKPKKWTNLFGPKLTTSNSFDSSNVSSYAHAFKFEPSKQFEFKPNFDVRQKPTFESVPNSSEASKPQTTDSPSSATFDLFGVKPTDSNSSNSSGTRRVEYSHSLGTDVNGNNQTITVFYHCITFMKEYEDKSLEEWRLEDYLISQGNITSFGSFGLPYQPNRNSFFGDGYRDIFATSGSESTGTTRVKFKTTVDLNPDNWGKNITRSLLQCITCMNEYKHISLEELRLEDYIAAGRFPQQPKRTPVGTAAAKFDPLVIDNILRHQCITFMEQYENKSMEELRFEDYTAGRKGHIPDAFKSQEPNCKTPFDPSESSTYKSEPQNTLQGNSKNTPTNNSGVPRRRIIARKQKRETQKNNGETLTQSHNTPAQSHDSPKLTHAIPKRHIESPTQNSETPTQNHDTPTKGRDPTTENWNTPTQNDESRWLAGERRREGDRNMQTGKFEEAVKLFSEAIKLNPRCLESKLRRAYAYLKLGKHWEALEDAKRVVDEEPDHDIAIAYIVRCYLALGEIAAGEQTIRRATESGESNFVEELATFASLRSKQEKARQLMSQYNYYDALSCLDQCLKRFSPSCSRMKLMKAECLAHMRKFEEARSIAIDVSLLSSSLQNVRTDDLYADSMYVVGLCSYHQDNNELAIKHFRKVLQHDPDHEKANKLYKMAKTRINKKLIIEKKEMGNEAFKRRQWQIALEYYIEALAIDKNNKEENAKLHYNRATVYARLCQPMYAAQACTAALELDENYVKALLRRAQCYTELGKYEEAMEDYEKLYYIDPTDENKRLLNEANTVLMANKGNNYHYKILGINIYASQDDIKKAYKKCALLHHPDRHAGASLPEVRKHERKFKQVKEAYDVLSDPVSRACYDRNQRRYGDSSDD